MQEIEKCTRCCRFYAENAEKFLADELAETDGTRTFICYQPLGTVLAIMPWNFLDFKPGIWLHTIAIE